MQATGSTSGVISGIIAVAIAMAVSFVLAFIMYKDEEKETDKKGNEPLLSKEAIGSPITGEVIKLTEVKDDAFAQGALGKGVAIIPTEGKVVSPVDGVVTTFFPTGHALGVTSNGGAEILIHIGMDTVQLEGKYFKPMVKQGAEVKKGQPLLEFDLDAIKAEGFDIVTPVIITNVDNYLDIVETNSKDIAFGEELINVIIRS